MTEKKTFITLIEDDDDAIKFEDLLEENCIKFECDMIGNETSGLIYEFKITTQFEKYIKFLTITHVIKTLDFISN